MIHTHLLDTSVYSQPIKRKPLLSVISHWQHIGERKLCTSIFCEMEILQGLEMKKSDKLRQAYENIIKNSITVLDFEWDAVNIYARIQAESVKAGKTRPVIDLLIASTAIANNLILATCNLKDFKEIPGLKVEDWSV